MIDKHAKVGEPQKVVKQAKRRGSVSTIDDLMKNKKLGSVLQESGGGLRAAERVVKPPQGVPLNSGPRRGSHLDKVTPAFQKLLAKIRHNHVSFAFLTSLFHWTLFTLSTFFESFHHLYCRLRRS